MAQPPLKKFDELRIALTDAVVALEKAQAIAEQLTDTLSDISFDYAAAEEHRKLRDILRVIENGERGLNKLPALIDSAEKHAIERR